MVEKKFGNVIHVVGPSGKPTFNFIDHDENYIKLVKIDDSKQYIILDKQSLVAFTDAFKKLAQQYTV